MAERLKQADLKKYATDKVGEPTLRDILTELEKPGRDPRAEFKYATFKEGVKDLRDLTVGMELEGVITNVANFGAFVDVGVHQDGLVHVSQLADKFVSDPQQIVKVGQVVKVRVLEVNESLKRISLSMKAIADGMSGRTGHPITQPIVHKNKRSPQTSSPQPQSQGKHPEQNNVNPTENSVNPIKNNVNPVENSVNPTRNNVDPTKTASSP
ncbi:MAG: S1 RNA-binding domain-containing protein [Leptolyngbyaceae cyanobacterium CSU_1_4]|nr:S1 RNA-binding domain-containing protein [Leptolyngbyaceae cyanobacterium CSU_1_4]